MFSLILLLILSGLLLAAWMLSEARAYQINRHSVVLKKSIPKPIRVLHLSDIHFAKADPKLSQLFDRLADEEVHFIFITGDIIDCEEGIPECIENLKKLKSSCGIYAVFGNHDYYDYQFTDVLFHSSEHSKLPRFTNRSDLLEFELDKLGVKVLKNQTVEAKAEGVAFLIHGVDDPITGKANLRSAMLNFSSEKINILLVHSIDVFLDIGENEIDLSFSGHLHGGQICLPFLGPVIVPTVFGRVYSSGIKPLKGAACSISRGMGTSRHFPFRLLSPPEAILLEITG